VQLHGLNDEERRKARAEAALLARLAHPCILRHIESFEDVEGHLCIVTEFCERGDLDGLLARARGAPLPEPRVLELFAQLALALLFLHKRKVRR
jgi:NIMA (never in mitosis gene a)-related kinase